MNRKHPGTLEVDDILSHHGMYTG